MDIQPVEKRLDVATRPAATGVHARYHLAEWQSEVAPRNVREAPSCAA